MPTNCIDEKFSFDVMQGVVKWFNSEKGYGFITSDNGKDHYFSVQSISGASLPSNGDSVQFESKLGDKGFRALNVKIMAKAPAQNSRSADDRINCLSCGKKIVPRIIVYNGSPVRSVCPYCANTVKTFVSNDNNFLLIVGAVLALVMMMLFK